MKLFKNLREKANRAATKAVIKIQTAVVTKRAEGYVDSGVKILIAVVIGALLLTLLYALFNDTIMPTVTERIEELFNFAG